MRHSFSSSFFLCGARFDAAEEAPPIFAQLMEVLDRFLTLQGPVRETQQQYIQVRVS